MLYLHFHKRSFELPLTLGTEYEFDTRFQDNWLLNDYVENIIKNLDNSEVIGNRAIQSPVLGVISPDWLSATCKNIIMMYYNEPMIFASSLIGNSAAPFIEQISEQHNIHVYMNHLFRFVNNQKAILVDCNNLHVSDYETIADYWVKEYDYSERIWDAGWLPGQMDKLGMNIYKSKIVDIEV